MTGVEVTFSSGTVTTFPTDREPWTFRDVLCIGDPDNYDLAAATRVPLVNIESYRPV